MPYSVSYRMCSVCSENIPSREIESVFARDLGLRCGREKGVKKYESRRQKHCPAAHSLPYAGPRVPRGVLPDRALYLPSVLNIYIVIISLSFRIIFVFDNHLFFMQNMHLYKHT